MIRGADHLGIGLIGLGIGHDLDPLLVGVDPADAAELGRQLLLHVGIGLHGRLGLTALHRHLAEQGAVGLILAVLDGQQLLQVAVVTVAAARLGEGQVVTGKAVGHLEGAGRVEGVVAEQGFARVTVQVDAPRLLGVEVVRQLLRYLVQFVAQGAQHCGAILQHPGQGASLQLGHLEGLRPEAQTQGIAGEGEGTAAARQHQGLALGQAQGEGAVALAVDPHLHEGRQLTHYLLAAVFQSRGVDPLGGLLADLGVELGHLFQIAVDLGDGAAELIVDLLLLGQQALVQLAEAVGQRPGRADDLAALRRRLRAVEGGAEGGEEAVQPLGDVHRFAAKQLLCGVDVLMKRIGGAGRGAAAPVLGHQIVIGDPADPGHLDPHAVIQSAKAGQAAHHGFLAAVTDGVDVGDILGGDV